MAEYCHLSGEPWTDALEHELTMPRIQARMRYWEKHPPIALAALAIAVRLEAIDPSDLEGGEAWGSLDELQAAFPRGIKAGDLRRK